jgi:uridine kinase
VSDRPDVRALAARVVAAQPSVSAVRVVCVDGPSGAGKTTLAAALVAELARSVGDVPVVHGDEVYEGWAVVADEADPVRAFSALGDRLVSWLVEPWRTGVEAEHPVWDWPADAWGGPRRVPAAPVVVLEGVGLGGAALRPHASLVVWLDADPALRIRRVAERDGAEVAAHMDAWREREAAWHAADRTAVHADVVLATG